jgi:hypothetical protein
MTKIGRNMKSLWILRQKTWKDVNSASVSKNILKLGRYSKHLLCLRQSQVFRSEYWTKFWKIWKLNPFRIFFNTMWFFWFYWISLIHFLTRFLVSFLLRDLKIYFDASIFRLRNENALKNYQRASGLKLFWTQI